ncbi:WD40-repeat-containing domain protein [Dichotomocladium elegans]|nr:WD40-repeat-containing domain protein [Dichotomocladium elegans]
MGDNSWVYGIRHQARCLTAVTASTEKSKFLVGTVGVKNNVICLLEFDEDKSEIIPTSFDHPDEVWDICACPADEALFFTSHSPVGEDPFKKKATLWKRQNNGLEEQLTLEHIGISRVIWDPNHDVSRIIATDTSAVYLSNPGTNDTLLSIKVIKDQEGDWLQNAAWNPHNRESIVTAAGDTMAGWDLRSGQNEFIRSGAHKGTIRAVDYNANKPYCVATGGDDAQVRIWDVRHLDEPLMVVEGHTHWVWCVAFNKFHDQLLLTSGSDTLVNLHNIVSVSSASYIDTSDENEEDDMPHDEDDYWISQKPTDGLICTYDQHEDSVYSVAWSPADTWTFASLSYAGRVVISQVPQAEKFKILGV